MKSWETDAVLETEEQKQHREKRKANRKHKLAVDLIKQYIVIGNIKRAIDIAIANGIDSKEFVKIVKSI